MEQARPNPDILLQEIRQSQADGHGRLKIFFGYAAGVGKTYAMLEAARQAAAAGHEVVAGYVEPHTRPETMRLLDGMEQLPPQTIAYHGMQLREFDLDAALRRKPQLILVDELAHTNAVGCRHHKRYQDVEELLRAGIDVYTTLNVQHLESLNDVVSSITGVTVRERVPDRIFDAAGQVEMVDIEPEDLILRLEQGKVYQGGQAEHALHHFFSRKNLSALREIALRRCADRLNRNAAQAVANAGDHILVCLSAAPSNAKVIRTAARMAEAFHSRFTALLVETPAHWTQNVESSGRLRANIKLAEELGAHIATAYGDDIALQIAEYAKASSVTKVVVGRTNHRRRRLSAARSLVDSLTELAPGLDVYIIPDQQPAYRPRQQRRAEPLSATDLGKTFLLLLLATLAGVAFDRLGLKESNIITVYILCVLLTATWTMGRLYGALASLLSVLLFNYLFTTPRLTLQVNDASYLITFVIMLTASFLTSSLTRRVKAQARQAAQKAYTTEVLLETSHLLRKTDHAEAALAAVARQLIKLLQRGVIVYAADADGLAKPLLFPLRAGQTMDAYCTPEEQAVAQWVYKNNTMAGATTDTLPGAKCIYLAVRSQRVFAVLGIVMEQTPPLSAAEKNLLTAMLGECGLTLEKISLHKQKTQAEITARQEALRANLLRAISHDLRTPLTSITGNAGILMEDHGALDEDRKRLLYTDIYDDSMWLVNLVENLLSITRIENNQMAIRMETELVDDIFREALSHLGRKAAEHHIQTALDDDLLLARVDARLIIQVIINLIDNAVKYTPPGSTITLSAGKSAPGEIYIRVADNGPGVPDAAKEKLFDMFYTAENAQGDGRRGMGLGLFLCKSIVSAHGGQMTVTDNMPHGAVFTFTLPAAEVHANE